MKGPARHTYPLLAASVATVVIYLVAWQNAAPLGPWQYALYASGALVAWLCWSLAHSSSPTHQDPDDPLATQRGQLEESLEQLAQQLDRREQLLTDKLMTFHEWMEFPEPVNLNREEVSSPSPELQEWMSRDRRMMDLLESETERIFNAILEDKYDQDGIFQPRRMWQELYELANQVARIYHPESTADHPLLETSAEQILVATSRVALQLLIVIEQLPLNVQERNINSLYTYVRRAVQAYGVYKAARPYLSIASSAFYVGRFALGTNPVGLGAWWLLQKIGKQTAETVGGRFLNRQALGLLQNMVRSVGFEVAQLYGRDFRYRDANWIYAVEVAELNARLPSSRASLTAAFREIGSLQLRSEYDRIFLYRALAAGQGCDPEKYGSEEILDAAERQDLANRLQQLAEEEFADVDSQALSEWQHAMRTRLGLASQS